MFKVGDYVVYKRNVCQINGMKENYFQGNDYYVLHPIDDESLVIDVPVDNKGGLLRAIISHDEAKAFIETIPSIPIIEVQDRAIENEYKALMRSNEMPALIKIIKTSYLRNDVRKENGKKISEIDENYLKRAEQILYNELSISLGMNFEEVREYVKQRIVALSNI